MLLLVGIAAMVVKEVNLNLGGGGREEGGDKGAIDVGGRYQHCERV